MSNAEIVVVGAGVAGLSAALAVADAGQDVTLVTKADLVESNTYHAQTTTRNCTRPTRWPRGMVCASPVPWRY